MHVRAGIVVFPGSNCDRDMMHVLRDVYGIDAQFFFSTKNLYQNPVLTQLLGKDHDAYLEVLVWCLD